MEVIINFFRCFFADSADFLQIFDSGLGNFLNRAEIIEQIAFAPGADSFNLVKAGFVHGLGPAFAVRADGEAVRLIADILHIKSQRRTERKLKAFASDLVVKLFAGITVRAF